MNKNIKCSIVAGVLLMCLISNVYATENNKIINEKVLKSKEDTFVSSIQKEFEEDSVKYKLFDYSKQEDQENSKIVTAYKKDTIKSNTKESIINHFGENINYDSDGYSGIITLKNYDIKTINNGKYEAIDEKKINFSKYSKNDLDNIEKEKNINGTTYYLINVKWENDDTENIIKTADYIIDLGPEGGDRGGQIVTTGTPEQVAQCEGSYTGKYLKKVLEKAQKQHPFPPQ